MFPYRKEMRECVIQRDKDAYGKLLKKLKYGKYAKMFNSIVCAILFCYELVSRTFFDESHISTIISVCWALLSSMSFAHAYYLDILSRMLEFEFNRD